MPNLNLVNLGTTINDGNGDSLRIAFEKCNDNFELLGNGFQTDLLEKNISHGDTAPDDPENGTLWFDTSNGRLKVWNEAFSQWLEITGDPTYGAVTISDTIPSGPVKGDLWLDTNTNELKLYDDSTGWTVFMSVIGTTQASPTHIGNSAPANPIQGDLWFNTTLVPAQMYVYNTVGMWQQVSDTDLRPVNVSVFTPNPSTSQIGDLWYDISLTNPVLKLYDGNNWILVNDINSPGDIVKISPTEPSPKEYGTIWYDINASTIKIFDGSTWRSQTATVSEADKGNKISYSETQPPVLDVKVGNLWYVPSTNKMAIYSGSAWVQFTGGTTYISDTAPVQVKIADEWFDGQELRSSIWDGANWLDKTGTRAFLSPTPPSNYMKEGDLYFNTSSNKLFMFEGLPDAWTDVSGSRTWVNPDSTPPTSPVIGDYWYVSDHFRLRVYTGNSWAPVHEKVYISNTTPTHALIGDLWVNTGSSNQLMANIGINQWIIVGGASSGNIVTTSSVAPVSPNAGDLWFDTVNTELMIYYNDGSSSQWVNANGANSNVALGGTSANRPSTPDLYQQYFDTTINKMIVWDGVNWRDFLGSIA